MMLLHGAIDGINSCAVLQCEKNAVKLFSKKVSDKIANDKDSVVAFLQKTIAKLQQVSLNKKRPVHTN